MATDVANRAILRTKMSTMLCVRPPQPSVIKRSTRFAILQQHQERLLSSSSSTTMLSSSSSSNSSWNYMNDTTKALADGILQEAQNPCKDSSSSIKRKLMNRRVALSKAITLMESKNLQKKQQGDYLLTYLLSQHREEADRTSEAEEQEEGRQQQSKPKHHHYHHDHHYSNLNGALRIGFAGPPGAGKSSLLEAFGMYLLNNSLVEELAVVCIDPSSGISGGSILGDKTRMNQLSCNPKAYVRPSSNSGILGGLAAYTDDVVTLLSVAGYPLVFVETVGLGQAEIEIVQSVDVLVLLLPPGGGDELQGVKKGIVELAHILAVTKADGNLLPAAKSTAADYRGAIRVLQQITSAINNIDCSNESPKAWQPPVLLTSSVTNDGLQDLWESIQNFHHFMTQSGKLEKKRQNQAKYWMWKQFTRMMQTKLQDDPNLSQKATLLETQLLEGNITPRVAAQQLLDDVF